MGIAIKSTAGNRRRHHSKPKSCSSESCQSTNLESSTKSTTKKSQNTTKTTAAPAENKSDASRSTGGASQTPIPPNTPENSIPTTSHGAGAPVVKICAVKPMSDLDVALDGQSPSTISRTDDIQNQEPLQSEGPVSPSSPSTSRHPHTPNLLHPDQNFVVFGWNAYRTRATVNEVCRLFLRRRCRMGENCSRIHPRGNKPPHDFLIKVKIAESPRPPAHEPFNVEERHGVGNMRHSTQPDPVIIKLPSAPILPRVSLPREETNQHIKTSERSQPGEGHGAVSGFSALNDRFNEGPSLNRSLVEKHPTEHQIDPNPRSDNSQSSRSSSSISNSTNSSPRMMSSQSSMTEEIRGFSPTISPAVARKFPPPPRHQEACRNWLLGRCSRGYMCHFVHDDLDYDPPVKGTHPPPPSSETCIKWLQDRCGFGYACRFVHGDLEYTAPTYQPPSVQGRAVQEPPIEKKNQQPQPCEVPPETPWSMTVDNHAKVVLGAGFEVKEVVTGFETPWVFIGNVPIRVTSEEITHLLDPFGPVLDVKVPGFTNSPTMNVKVRLSTSKLATEASTTLNNTLAFGGIITARLPISNALNAGVFFRDTAVHIQWEAPGKIGYGGYSSMEHAYRAIAAARIPFRDNHVKASIHTGLPVVGVVTVKFRGVPIDANEGDMERFAHPEDVVWERPNYSSLPRAISWVKRILEEQTGLLSLDILPPPYRGTTVSAWAHFSTANDAQEARNRLHGRKPVVTGMTTISARHEHSLGYSVTPIVYQKVGPDIETFKMSIWRQNRSATMSIARRPPPQTILVRISSEDPKELGRIKSDFEKILNGEVLREAGKAAWDDFFTHPEGAAFLKATEHQHPGVTIQLDAARRILKLLGSFRSRDKVRRALLSRINSLRSQQVRTIALDGPLVGAFVISELHDLQYKIGGENVILELWSRCLRIRGDDSVFETAQEAVRLAREKYQRGHRVNVVACPVCFDQVTAPVTLRCGHTWCRSCLAGYLMSSIDNKYFPLTCLGNDAKCTERIPLSVAQEILPVHNLDAIVHAAFSSHVQTRPEEFHYCPSPDCPQIYRATTRGTVLQCPSCLLRICPSCHVEAHDGFACPDADGGDKRFREWMREHDVKNCPGCKIPIERAEGCNHMTCTRCQTHICWECLETFPKGQGIYDHMRSVHGGIGLAPVEY